MTIEIWSTIEIWAKNLNLGKNLNWAQKSKFGQQWKLGPKIEICAKNPRLYYGILILNYHENIKNYVLPSQPDKRVCKCCPIQRLFSFAFSSKVCSSSWISRSPRLVRGTILERFSALFSILFSLSESVSCIKSVTDVVLSPEFKIVCRRNNLVNLFLVFYFLFLGKISIFGQNFDLWSKIQF